MLNQISILKKSFIYMATTIGIVVSLTATQSRGQAQTQAPARSLEPSQEQAPAKIIAATFKQSAIVNVHGRQDLNIGLSFEDWLNTEAQIAFTKMMANVSPSGSASGSVVASPSKFNPDYWFTWVRDSALVMNVVVDNYAASQGADKALWFKTLADYASFSRRLQQSNAPTGLGEPKFEADGSVFSGPWGRPQNDSPALRALTLCHWATDLIADNQTDFVRQNLYASETPASKVIKADLEYVAYHWRESSFDLWEEVRGDHFYTRMVQHAALRAGSKLAAQLGDAGAANFYSQQADQVEQSIESFWDNQRSTFVTTLNRVDGLSYKTSNLDSALVLGVLHAGFNTGALSPMDDRVMATAAQVEGSMAGIYAINDANRFAGVAPAIGRYQEDTFSGQDGIHVGNPWVLNTAAFAELYYKVATATGAQGKFTISARNLAFIRNAVGAQLGSGTLVPGLQVTKGTAEFDQLIQKLLDRGDAFMRRVRLHENPDGSLAEQIDRTSGYMCSAHDLTWSYAAFITAFWARP